MSMFNKNDYQHGRLGAVGNRATIAAMKQQTNPQAMSDADYRTLSNRKWAENQKRYGGGGAKNSIDELWGEKSFGAIQARSNAQASAEGAMAGQYGGRNVGSIKAANMQSFKDNHYHNNAKRAYELSSLGARARSDNAAAYKAEFDNSYLSQDKANEYKMHALREAGVELDNANTQQSMDMAAQRQTWAGQDRQAQQADALIQAKMAESRFRNSVPALEQEYSYFPKAAFGSQEDFDYYLKYFKTPSKAGTVEYDQDGNRVFWNTNESAQLSPAHDPNMGRKVSVDGLDYYTDQNGDYKLLFNNTQNTGGGIQSLIHETQNVQSANDGGAFNLYGQKERRPLSERAQPLK